MQADKRVNPDQTTPFLKQGDFNLHNRDIEPGSWKGRDVGCLSAMWDSLCAVIRQIFDAFLSLCCCQNRSEQQKTSTPKETTQHKTQEKQPLGKSDSSLHETDNDSLPINNHSLPTNNHSLPTNNFQSASSNMQTDKSNNDFLLHESCRKEAQNTNSNKHISGLAHTVLATAHNAEVGVTRPSRPEPGRDALVTPPQLDEQLPVLNIDNSLKITGKKNITSSENICEEPTQNPNDLLSLGDTQLMDQFRTNEESIRVSFAKLSDEEAFTVVCKCWDLPLSVLGETQQNYYIKNVNVEHVNAARLKTKNNHINEERFRALPNEIAAAFMLGFFDAVPDSLPTNSQKDYFYSNLKAKDVDEKLCRKLYFLCFSGETEQKRFGMLPNEEAAAFMFKFDFLRKHRASESQENYFYSNLKAKDLDENFCRKLYFLCFSGETEQKRFGMLPNEEAAALMFKFDFLRDHRASESQENYFYSNLKAKDLDEKLCKKLYFLCFSGETERKRFGMLSNEEAAALMFKFDFLRDHRASKSQESYFYRNLKAKDVDEESCKKLFFSGIPYSSEIGQKRFEMLPDEEAAALMFKFDFLRDHRASNSQKKYFYSNLKAKDIDKEFCEKLFKKSYSTTEEEKRYFRMLQDEEAVELFEKFPDIISEDVLSESQKNYASKK